MKNHPIASSRKKHFKLTDRISSPLNLYEHLPFQIAVVSNLLQLNRDPLIRGLVELEPREIRVILNIGSYMPINSAEIAYQSRMDAYTISRAVKRLEALNLVVFESDGVNKKVKFLLLTDDGEILYKKICLQIEKRQSLIEAKLTESEKHTLIQLLAKLEDNTEAMLANNAQSKLSSGENLSADQREIIRWWRKSHS